jgi:flagellar motor switch protein FliN/FliY
MLDEALSKALQSFASLWVDSAFDTLSLAVDREFKLQPRNASELSTEDLDALGSKYQIAVRVPVSEEAGSGETCLLISMADATALADLLSEGEGASSEALSDEALNSLQEGVNQMTVAAEAGLKNGLGDTFSLGSSTIVDLAAGEEKLIDVLGAEVVGVEFSLACADFMNSTTFLLMATSTLQQLSEKINSAGESAGGEAAVAGSEDEVGAAPAAVAQAVDEENLGLLLDVELAVVARLGQVEMPVRDVLSLGPGSIIEVGRSVEEPVELLVNEKLIARGEVVVVDEKFGLRITEIISPTERVRSLR